jgi:predicted aspartyl protease
MVWMVMVSGCASSKLTIRPEDNTPVSAEVRRYSTFWDAVDNADLEAAQRDATAEQKTFAAAMQLALDGKADEAAAAARSLWLATPDSATRHHSRELLESLLMTQSRWQDILEVYAKDTNAVDPEDDVRPLVNVYAAAPAEDFRFPAVADTLPIDFNGVGLPVVEVIVNGHRKKFILDTGAALTVLSSDFARECGVTASDQSAIAGTSNTKTVAIQGAIADSLRWGSLLILHHPTAVIESSHLRFRLFGLFTLMKIDGILGWNVIRELNLVINYRDKYAVVQASQPRETETRNFFDLGEPMVMLTDGQGRRFNFLLDTGANVTSLGQNSLNKISIKGLKHRTAIVGGAGGMEKYKAVVVPHLTLYTNGYALDFENLRTSPEAKEDGIHRDGILGSDFGHRGAITVDYHNGYFAFEELSKSER